jgi:hypothetical protein
MLPPELLESTRVLHSQLPRLKSLMIDGLSRFCQSAEGP